MDIYIYIHIFSLLLLWKPRVRYPQWYSQPYENPILGDSTCPGPSNEAELENPTWIITTIYWFKGKITGKSFISWEIYGLLYSKMSQTCLERD